MAKRVKFETIVIDFKDFENGIRLRNVRNLSDVKNYYEEFSDVEMSKALKKSLSESYITRLQNHKIESGNMDLVIEDLNGNLLGMLEIANIEKTCTGCVLISIPNDEKSEKYAIKAIDALIALASETYLYDDLVLNLESREACRYIKEKNCKANIKTVSKSKSA